MFFIWVALVPPAAAQDPDSPEGLVAEIRAAFNALDYERVDSLARQALERHEAYRPGVLVDIHTLHGLSSYYRGSESVARVQFEAALSLDPTLALDPLMVPPRALDFFREVKDRMQVVQQTPQASTSLRYIVLEDDRPAAVLRSFVAPGWGQLYKEQTTKGIALLSLWTTSAGGGLVAHLARQRAEERYLDATGAAAIAQHYDSFNRWHKIRNNLLLAAAVVWIYSAVDAAVTGGPLAPPVARQNVRAHLLPASAHSAPLLHVQIRF